MGFPTERENRPDLPLRPSCRYHEEAPSGPAVDGQERPISAVRGECRGKFGRFLVGVSSGWSELAHVLLTAAPLVDASGAWDLVSDWRRGRSASASGIRERRSDRAEGLRSRWLEVTNLASEARWSSKGGGGEGRHHVQGATYAP